jgi:hypothetical protein
MSEREVSTSSLCTLLACSAARKPQAGTAPSSTNVTSLQADTTMLRLPAKRLPAICRAARRTRMPVGFASSRAAVVRARVTVALSVVPDVSTDVCEGALARKASPDTDDGAGAAAGDSTSDAPPAPAADGTPGAAAKGLGRSGEVGVAPPVMLAALPPRPDSASSHTKA